ncbi:MAG: hypothetical protein RLZZ223_210 [Candidatus Parcubacteria bacterium]|jgi:hypothetical protein
MSLVQQKAPRLHPIGEPDHPLQVRSIGLLNGVIDPSGTITLTGNFHGKSLILGDKVYGLVQKLIKKGQEEAIFTVYPRTKDGFVTSFEVIGVWKPSILDPDNSEAQDDLPEGDNYFSIRGEVCHKVWCDENYGRSVAVQVCGQHFVTVDFVDSPYLSKGDFVSLEAILTEDGRLYTERVEKISIPDAALTRPRRHHGHQMVRRRSSAA